MVARKIRLREVDGLLEDIEVSLPVAWAETLRSRAGKLGLSLADFLAQYCGHLTAEIEALETAVESPTIGDDAARFRLRGGLLKTFQAESLRTGLPVRALAHRAISDAADVFAGREKQPAPAPLILIPKVGRR